MVFLLFPMAMQAQKEDFQPPKVNQKNVHLQKAPSKKNNNKRVSPQQQEEKAKLLKQSEKKSNKKRSVEPQDTLPTPGFIKYIPKMKDSSYDFSKFSDYQLEVMAAHNNLMAQVELGGRWLLDETGENLAKGIAWLEKAAKANSSDAQALLGLYYYQNLNDGNKALPLLISSARQGNAMGQYYLGLAYLYGEYGIKLNPEAAIYYFTLAAKQGLPAAQYCVGYCLYYGIGTERNWEWAKMWMEYAASNGDEDAEDFLKSNPFTSNLLTIRVSN